MQRVGVFCRRVGTIPTRLGSLTLTTRHLLSHLGRHNCRQAPRVSTYSMSVCMARRPVIRQNTSNRPRGPGSCRP